jgi:hypothetical protein
MGEGTRIGVFLRLFLAKKAHGCFVVSRPGAQNIWVVTFVYLSLLHSNMATIGR